MIRTHNEYAAGLRSLSTRQEKKFHTGYQALQGVTDRVGRWNWQAQRIGSDEVIAEHKGIVRQLLAYVALDWIEKHPMHGMSEAQGKRHSTKMIAAYERDYERMIVQKAKTHRLCQLASVSPDGKAYLPAGVERILRKHGFAI